MQNAHISTDTLRDLHRSLLDIVSVVNQPHRDDVIIQKAGIRLDRALFPLLVGIERYGPIGIVDLAERAGRNYTTVSRQVAKLEELGLIDHQKSKTDRRIHAAVITTKGKKMIHLIDTAREKMGREIFQSWEKQEIAEFARLMRKFADAIQ